MKIKSYAELQAWQKAHELALAVFKITELFPRSDLFGIVSQMRRSSSSVAANIAEGFGRGTTKERMRSLQISRGELEETRYFPLLSRALGTISKEEFRTLNNLCDSVGRLLNAFSSSLRRRLLQNHQSPIASELRSQ